MSARRRLVVLTAVAAVFARQGAAQGGPPPPLPMGEVVFPAFEERALANGARVLVVSQHEVPFVTINLVIPGGTAVDPEGIEGTATFTAQLLTRGTAARTFDDIARALDDSGISFAAAATEEWTTISLNAVTTALDEGLAVLADVVMNATFPDAAFEQTRTQALSGLRVQSSRPDVVADRAFTRALYGAHPYGRMPTIRSVQALTRSDVEAFHDEWYRPEEAWFVVAGDVDVDAITRRLEIAFAGWTSATRPPVDGEWLRAPDRMRPEIVVVHQPGAVQAEVRVGHLLPGGQIDEWEELVVANQILGGGPAGRLQQVLRNARGYTYDARSTLTRERRLGRFVVSTAVRNEVLGDAVQEILNQVEQLRTRRIPQAELDDKKGYLVGSFPSSIETPQQVAAQVTTNRLLGLSDLVLERYRDRVAMVDTAQARAAAERWLRPEQFLIVVAGDAALLQPQLRGLGEATILDPEGGRLTLADLAPRPASTSFDLSGLEPASLGYDVKVGGVVLGQAVRTLEPVAEGWRFASVIDAGPQHLEQEVVVDDRLALISSRNAVSGGARESLVEARREGGRLVGRAAGGGEERAIDLQVPADVTLSDGIELALWASDLAVGSEIRLPVVDIQSGRVDNVVLRVEEATEVTVPAGTFPVFRVTVSGREAQTFHVRIAAPHIPIRMESASQPVALELTRSGRR